MAMQQRNDTIEAIKRQAAEKKAVEEKKKAEARARAAYRRKQRNFHKRGKRLSAAGVKCASMKRT